MKRLYYTPIIFQKIAYIVFFVLHHLFVRLEIRGKENLSNLDKPIILAMNHTGELDVTVTPLFFSFFSKFFPIYYMTNSGDKYKEVKKFGWRSLIYGDFFFGILGGCPIYSGYKDYAVSLRNHIALLKEGNMICIFPEGKVTLDGKIGEARGGLGYLVYSTGATVVPVAINTFFQMSCKKYFSFQRKVVVTICKPMFKNEIINVPNPNVEDFRLGSQKVLDRIGKELNERWS